MARRRTEDEFMDELTALFLAHGVSSLTVADIAARLSCSRRRIYALAATKEELFLLVSRRLFDSLVQEGHEVARGKSDISEAITAYLGVGARAAARIGVAFLADLDATEKGRQLSDDYQSARLRGMEHLVDEGVAQGHFAPHNSRLVAEILLGAAQRLRRPQFLREAGLTLEQAFEDLYKLVLHGLLVTGRQAAGEKPPPAGRAGRSGRARRARQEGQASQNRQEGQESPQLADAETGGQREQVERILERMATR